MPRTKKTAPVDDTGAVNAVKKTRKKKAVETAEIIETAVKVEPTKIEPTEDKNMNTVIVCCNEPHNIIFSIADNAGRKQKIEINGNAVHLKGKTQGKIPVGAYGMTVIDKDAWEKIKAKYGRMPAFINGRIFASESKVEAESESENRKNLRHGKEPIDVNSRKTTTTPDNSANI